MDIFSFEMTLNGVVLPDLLDSVSFFFGVDKQGVHFRHNILLVLKKFFVCISVEVISLKCFVKSGNIATERVLLELQRCCSLLQMFFPKSILRINDF